MFLNKLKWFAVSIVLLTSFTGSFWLISAQDGLRTNNTQSDSNSTEVSKQAARTKPAITIEDGVPTAYPELAVNLDRDLNELCPLLMKKNKLPGIQSESSVAQLNRGRLELVLQELNLLYRSYLSGKIPVNELIRVEETLKQAVDAYYLQTVERRSWYRELVVFARIIEARAKLKLKYGSAEQLEVVMTQRTRIAAEIDLFDLESKNTR